MKLPAMVVVIATGISNIVLNVWVRAAAQKPVGARYFDSLLSREFLVAFVVGLGSVLCLLLVHRSPLNFPQAIALMGAVSIVGGSIYGCLRGERLQPLEVTLVVVIAVLFLYRWVAARDVSSP